MIIFDVFIIFFTRFHDAKHAHPQVRRRVQGKDGAA